MLCKTCQNRLNCIPAALAANDHPLYTLLERLKQCDRHRPEQSSTTLSVVPRPTTPVRRSA